ncbi:MAG: M24 family metallopeptidase [Spirochaetota bacterium]
MKADECGIDLKSISDQFENTGVLLSNPDSITYVTGIEFPFPGSFPERPVACLILDSEAAAMICPYEWCDALRMQGWSGTLITYGDGERDPLKVVAEAIGELCSSSSRSVDTISYEAESISYELFSQLQVLCPEIHWTAADKKMHSLRMEKNESQITLLRDAAEQLEFGLIGAIQHLEGSLEENGYTLSEFCERIRVHVYETGGTASGLSAAAAGSGLQQWYDKPSGKFTAGELVRLEATSRYYGYWANTARMIVIGEANQLQQRAYQENLLLKQTAVSMLNPGVKSAIIHKELVDLAAEKGIDFCSDFGAGHGIGTSEREAPFLDGYDQTVLSAGMCIVVAVYTEGPRKELLCSKDTYYLSEKGPVCLSSYHNWDGLYEVTGFRSAH